MRATLHLVPRTVSLLVTLAAIPSVATAAEQGFTLAAAVERALEISARSDAYEARFRASLEAASQARSDRLPIVGLRASYARLSHVPELTFAPPSGPPTTIFPDLPDRYDAALDFSVPVATGGRTSARIDAADRTAVAASADLDAVRHDVVLEVTTAYWSLVGAIETERVLEESLASYEAHLTEARARRDVGLAAENDVLAVQVERDRAELGRIEAAANTAIARANLVRLLALPDGSVVAAIDPLTEPAAPAAPAAQLIAEALERRPERAALDSRVRAAEASVEVERASRKPQASVDASFVYANPNLRVLPLDASWEDTWSIGIGASLRLFDGGRAKHGAARARAEVDTLRAELVDLDRRIALDVTSAREALEATRAGIPVADRGLAAAQEDRRVTSDRYHEGVVPSSDLLDSESRLLFAGLERTRTLVRAAIATAQLDRAVGR